MSVFIASRKVIFTSKTGIEKVFKAAELEALQSMRMIQKQKTRMPYELKSEDVERCFFVCDQLLEKQKREELLHQIVTVNEK